MCLRFNFFFKAVFFFFFFFAALPVFLELPGSWEVAVFVGTVRLSVGGALVGLLRRVAATSNNPSVLLLPDADDPLSRMCCLSSERLLLLPRREDTFSVKISIKTSTSVEIDAR